jgi:beta-lactam-binding protein with PASTA domain
MPIEIRVVDFTDQTGETEAAATAALLALDPDVQVAVEYENNSDVEEGVVISQTVEAVTIEEAGGEEGSHGTRVTLLVSLGSVVTHKIIFVERSPKLVLSFA